jgi:hypothetical protein
MRSVRAWLSKQDTVTFPHVALQVEPGFGVATVEDHGHGLAIRDEQHGRCDADYWALRQNSWYGLLALKKKKKKKKKKRNKCAWC